jgi:hypothetical protein
LPWRRGTVVVVLLRKSRSGIESLPNTSC